MKIKIITDSSSGITKEESEQFNIGIVPMPFTIDDSEYFEGVNITRFEFFEKVGKATRVQTSMPSVLAVYDAWDEALKTNDAVVYIPISSGLSSSYETAFSLAKDEAYEGRVFVCDAKRVIVLLKQICIKAAMMAKEGYLPEEILGYINDNKESTIYLTLDTLNYLAKGGRLNKYAATAGELLKLKPVASLNDGGKISVCKVLRTTKQAYSYMINRVREELANRYREENLSDMVISVAYSDDEKKAIAFKEMLIEELGIDSSVVKIEVITLTIACHIGPGGVGVILSKALKSSNAFVDDALLKNDEACETA